MEDHRAAGTVAPMEAAERPRSHPATPVAPGLTPIAETESTDRMTDPPRPVVRIESPAETPRFGDDGDCIHAVLVTGKSADRRKLLRASVLSFLAQSHPNRVLVIVNDGDFDVEVANVPKDRLVQLRPASRRSLGALRNLALDIVPAGAPWTPWDDDDWRHPGLLAAQHRVMRSMDVDACLLRNQVKYDLRTDAAFVDRHPGGFCGTILARNQPSLRHPEWARSEDSAYVAQWKERFSWFPWTNPAHSFVRFFHGGNTWDAEHFGLARREPGTWRVDARSAEILRSLLPAYRDA